MNLFVAGDVVECAKMIDNSKCESRVFVTRWVYNTARNMCQEKQVCVENAARYATSMMECNMFCGGKLIHIVTAN